MKQPKLPLPLTLKKAKLQGRISQWPENRNYEDQIINNNLMIIFLIVTIILAWYYI